MIENKNNKNDGRALLSYDTALDYLKLMEYLEVFTERYDFLSFFHCGKTILGRAIPALKIGQGNEKSLLYVGAHHGMEWLTSLVLLRFINEFCEIYKSGRKIYGLDLSYIFLTRSIYILPMLNPDGVDYQINGVAEDNPLYERLIDMNGGSQDFSAWQANGRGVDLNHNYNSSFAEYKVLEREAGIVNGAPTRYSGESPESEPEVAALCNLVRTFNTKMVLTLHSQGEEIYYTSGGVRAPRSEQIASLFSKMSGYALATPEGMAAYGGLTDWFIREFDRPSFTIECGKGKNPLPLSDYYNVYMKLREMLFVAPTLI